MTQDKGLDKLLNALFFGIFFGLIAFSIWISYRQLFVGRYYQVFYSEDQADEANIGLYSLIKETIYGITH